MSDELPCRCVLCADRHGDQAERHPLMTREADDLRAEVDRLRAENAELRRDLKLAHDFAGADANSAYDAHTERDAALAADIESRRELSMALAERDAARSEAERLKAAELILRSEVALSHLAEQSCAERLGNRVKALQAEAEQAWAAQMAEREACAQLVRHWGVDRERFVLAGPRAIVDELARIEVAILARGGA